MALTLQEVLQFFDRIEWTRGKDTLLIDSQHAAFVCLLTIAETQKDSLRMIRSAKSRPFYPEKVRNNSENDSKGKRAERNRMDNLQKNSAKDREQNEQKDANPTKQNK